MIFRVDIFLFHALGFKLETNRMKIFGLSWMLEFINIDKWTFLHHGNFTLG